MNHPVADGIGPAHGAGKGFEHRGVGVAGPGIDVVAGLDAVPGPEQPQLEGAGAGVDDEDGAQVGQTQSRTSGRSSPNSRV